MMWSGVMIKMVQSMLLRINEISNALYVAIVLFLAVLIIPDDGGFHLPLLAFITVAWPIYFVYLRVKKTYCHSNQFIYIILAVPAR